MIINEVDICGQLGLQFSPLMPFISGSVLAPNTLTGQLITNQIYQWVRDNTDIPGANAATYNLTAADIGHLIRVRMSFTDADNNFVTVISKPIGPIKGGGAFVSSGIFATNTGGSSISVPMPTGLVPGSLIFVWIGGNAPQTASTVSGWTFLNTSIASDYVVAYKIADGSEGASVNFPFSGNSGLIGQALQFAGISSANPLGVHNTNTGSGSTASSGGITTDNPRCLVLGVIQTNSNQQIPSPSGWVATSGFNSGSAPYAFGALTVTQLVTPAGPTSPFSASIASASWRVSLYELIANSQ